MTGAVTYNWLTAAQREGRKAARQVRRFKMAADGWALVLHVCVLVFPPMTHFSYKLVL